jgi:WD40 repeat protein
MADRPEAGSSQTSHKTNIFVSYSRKDSAFIDVLVTALSARGYDVRIDRSDITKGEEWWKRIVDLIVSSTLVVFVISPDSIVSPVCTDEVQLTQRLGKRIVPLLWRNGPGLAIPRGLSERDWVSFEAFEPAVGAYENPTFASALAELETAINLDDVLWVREHAQWLKRALDWDGAGRPQDAVMRAREITAAQLWIGHKPANAQAVPNIVSEFISASLVKEQHDREELFTRERQISAGLQRLVAEAAASLRAQGRYSSAMRVALAGEPTETEVKERGFTSEPTRRAHLAASAHSSLCLVCLSGHCAPVRHAAFSPDGSRVITASADKTARLWDAETGAELARLVHDDGVSIAAFSFDGARVVTVSGDTWETATGHIVFDRWQARIWDSGSGAELARLPHGTEIASAAFSPDGTQLLTASSEGAWLWDVRTGFKLDRLTHGNEWSRRGAFNPDGTRLVTHSATPSRKEATLWERVSGSSGSAWRAVAVLAGDIRSAAGFSFDGSLLLTASESLAQLWDARTGAKIADLSSSGKIACASISPDGDQVVTAERSTVQLWGPRLKWPRDSDSEPDIAWVKLVRLEHSKGVNAAVFSPDGARILTASDDKTARLWDADTGAELARLVHDERVAAAVFSSDGARVITSSDDKTARLWDVGSIGPIIRLLHVRLAVFSPDGARVLTASDDKTARLWDADTGMEFARLVHDQPVAAAFNRNGTRVVTASADETARLWDAETGAELARLVHDQAVAAADFSPDGARVLTASNDKTARLWDADTGAELARLVHDEPVTAGVFSRDGVRVLTVSNDKTARLWDADTGAELLHLGHNSSVIRATFSPDGTRIITNADRSDLSKGGAVRIWDATKGKEITLLRGHESHLTAAAFNPAGSQVVTASADKTARLWDAETGAELARLVHDDGVSIAAFSSDGARVVTVSGDATYETAAGHMVFDRWQARIWDSGSGAELARLPHGTEIASAAFSPDGTRLVTASDAAAQVWDVHTGLKLASFANDGKVRYAVFSPDATRLVIRLENDTIALWDTIWLTKFHDEALVRAAARTRLVGELRLTEAELRMLHPLLGKVGLDVLSRWLKPSPDDSAIEAILDQRRRHRGLALALARKDWAERADTVRAVLAELSAAAARTASKRTERGRLRCRALRIARSLLRPFRI